MPNAAIILAAGRGDRIRKITSDKILTSLAGRPAIVYSVEAFLQSGAVSTIAIVYRDVTQQSALRAALTAGNLSAETIIWIAGGSERQESVLAGLRALPENTELVFIHDAARPLITPATIRTLTSEAMKTGAACLAHRVTDTIKEVLTQASTEASFRLKTVDRSRLWAVETPQVFRHSLILDAYEEIQASGRRITDDTSALEGSAHPVTLVESTSPNPKLTTPADFAYIEYLLKSRTDSLQ
jgi:2-C-methyl-D-erythritol 4-phosphate cytidylyltransferase